MIRLKVAAVKIMAAVMALYTLYSKQTTTMMPQSSVVEPAKLENVQLVIFESLYVLTQLAHRENEHNTQFIIHYLCILFIHNPEFY